MDYQQKIMMLESYVSNVKKEVLINKSRILHMTIEIAWRK